MKAKFSGAISCKIFSSATQDKASLLLESSTLIIIIIIIIIYVPVQIMGVRVSFTSVCTWAIILNRTSTKGPKKVPDRITKIHVNL